MPFNIMKIKIILNRTNNNILMIIVIKIKTIILTVFNLYFIKTVLNKNTILNSNFIYMIHF